MILLTQTSESELLLLLTTLLLLKPLLLLLTSQMATLGLTSQLRALSTSQAQARPGQGRVPVDIGSRGRRAVFWLQKQVTGASKKVPKT